MPSMICNLQHVHNNQLHNFSIFHSHCRQFRLFIRHQAQIFQPVYKIISLIMFIRSTYEFFISQQYIHVWELLHVGNKIENKFSFICETFFNNILDRIFCKIYTSIKFLLKLVQIDLQIWQNYRFSPIRIETFQKHKIYGKHIYMVCLSIRFLLLRCCY